jgi:hypothetical protein
LTNAPAWASSGPGRIVVKKEQAVIGFYKSKPLIFGLVIGFSREGGIYGLSV